MVVSVSFTICMRVAPTFKLMLDVRWPLCVLTPAATFVQYLRSITQADASAADVQ